MLNRIHIEVKLKIKTGQKVEWHSDCLPPPRPDSPLMKPHLNPQDPDYYLDLPRTCSWISVPETPDFFLASRSTWNASAISFVTYLESYATAIYSSCLWRLAKTHLDLKHLQNVSLFLSGERFDSCGLVSLWMEDRLLARKPTVYTGRHKLLAEPSCEFSSRWVPRLTERVIAVVLYKTPIRPLSVLLTLWGPWVELEPIAADIGQEAGYTLDRPPAYRKPTHRDKQRFQLTLPWSARLWTVGGSQSTWNNNPCRQEENIQDSNSEVCTWCDMTMPTTATYTKHDKQNIKYSK